MDIHIYIDGDDKSDIIEFGSVKKTDSINNDVDTLDFSIFTSPSQEYAPSINSEVTMYDGTELIYGGVITEIDVDSDGDMLLLYRVHCKDYSHYLDRSLVLERFQNETVQNIIVNIITKYAISFTTTNVLGSGITLDAITFDRMTVTQVLSTLAKQLNYSWYVDYEKDIHFFPKNEELAPFDITDVSQNYIFDSINVNYDFTQIRNRIIVKGGEQVSNERTLYLSGTGTNTAFPLAYKFSSKPTVVVDTVEQTVGIDGIDNEDSFDCLWSYQQKYLKFPSTNIPSADVDNIVVTGTPLLPVTVIVSDSTSISQYGAYEFKLEDSRLSTRDDAIALGNAELTAYKDPQITISFDTNTSGLRSGQTLSVDSDRYGITDDFVVQKVSFTTSSMSLGLWRVEIATLRTLTLTKILQSLFKSDVIAIDELESLYASISLSDTASVSDEVGTPYTSSPPYTWNGGGNDTTWNFGTWS